MSKHNQQVNPPPPMDELSPKKTKPNIPSSKKSTTSAFSLVEPMEFMYIRIVKGKDPFDQIENDPENYKSYIEVRIGNYKAITKSVEKTANPEWNQIFAFSKERVHTFFIEILMKKKGENEEVVKGRVVFDVNEVPKRVPPDSPLAPQWYKLEDPSGVCAKEELMVAVWIGTQADEAFTEAWNLDAAGVCYEDVVNTKAKVYMSPKLWYLRVNVIQAQNLEIANKNKKPEVFVKAVFGDAVARTKFSTSRNFLNPLWNEDLMFVAAEPFEHLLNLTVVNKAGNNEEVIGNCVIHLGKLERRLGSKPVDARWYSLERPGENCKIQLRASLDGGYHVLDETVRHSSDTRPTVRQLWKQELGVLELGILNATGLPHMKMRSGQQGRTDAYCVAKYGQKWVRTRTIIDSSSPQWNEQYTWVVYDHCTVITIGVFDNCQFHSHDNNAKQVRDSRIGKIRIRLSTLEADRIYTYSFPLLVLEPQGLKKMGELQLAIRFSCSSVLSLLQGYVQPILPSMHYSHPLSLHQQEYLRHQATKLVAMRLGRSEPPLRKEIVEDMLDYDSRNWSQRRTAANCRRIKAALSGVGFVFESLESISSWKRPFLSVLVHLFLIFLVFFPQFIFPAICFNFGVIGMMKYQHRPRNPPHMDPQLSSVHGLSKEDLDEEFDGIPTMCKNNDSLKYRYNRLRVVAGQLQVLLGDVATQLERVQSLFNWRDPRATALFVGFCVVFGIVLCLIPTQLVIIMFILYTLRPSKFRSKQPSVPANFFRRLPAKADSLL